MAKFRPTPGNIKSVVNCMLLEEQMRLLDLEPTEQPQCNQSFPVTVALDDHGHGTQGTSSLMGIPHPGNGEDIYSTTKDAHHLN
eukprot:9281843-Ditylum_brightwellii.AAC.1